MSAKRQSGMGRGLDAILSGTGISGSESLRRPVGYVNSIPSTQPAALSGTSEIPVTAIVPNPYQPRNNFDTSALEELAESIRTFGIIQPITVRLIDNGKYQIISGERRFRAARMAGLATIPAYVRDTDDQGMLEIAIVENIQREDLDPIEVALSYRRLMDECNLTHEQLSRRVGRRRASVTNCLRLLKLPPKVQHALKSRLLSVGHAKVLLSTDDAILQESLCDEVIRQDLSVRQLEERLSRAGKGANVPASGSEELPDDYYKVLEHLGKYFSNNISLRRTSSGKGTITIRFGSDREMQSFLKALDESGL